MESDKAVRARPIKDEIITGEPSNNITDYIYEKIGVNLHHQPNHPIGIIKQAIYDYFEAKSPGTFSKLDVSTKHSCCKSKAIIL
jgi:phenylalanyl-tRNA synthetase alpha chain